MSLQTREQLKARFQNGVEANQNDFANVFDSYYHKTDDTLPAPPAPDWDDITGKPTTFTPSTHTHDASAIVSGVLDVARIPVLPSQVQVISSGDLTALTVEQQAQIGKGTVVTTTDGSRWVYTGTGSKTDSANYIQLADITPEWSAVQNKPSSFTPSAHTHTTSEITGLDNALAGKADAAATAATGTVVAFVAPQIYGLVTAETGNITADHTNAKVGMVQLMRHQHSSAPTFASEFKKIGGTYTNNVMNYIMFFYVSNTEILYTISQVG